MIINREFDIKDITNILFLIFPVDINGVINEEITKTATENIL